MLPPAKILITGITGFIGAHLAVKLIKLGYAVTGVRRVGSDCKRCGDVEKEITWITIDDNLKQAVCAVQPDMIIHCAWAGTNGSTRDDMPYQQQNLEFLNTLLQAAAETRVSKFIALGSQAEYGLYHHPVSEDSPACPNTAYGKVKAEALQLVQQWGNSNDIDWYWLRLFSCYGPGESTNWLIPQVITALIENRSSISLSTCTQKYAYLYIEDLAEYVALLVESDKPEKGVYNISGLQGYELKAIILKIRDYFKESVTELAFGALPSRAGQPDTVQGTMNKFHERIGNIRHTPLTEGIEATVKYYKNQFK